MTSTSLRTLFRSDVTRDISPVVYFHEQTPEKIQAEVSEYIITGGWPEAHPNRQRVPDGIHEQYVRLLRGSAASSTNKAARSCRLPGSQASLDRVSRSSQATGPGSRWHDAAGWHVAV